MKCILSAAFLSFSLACNAQKYSVKTIFELLNIENQSCEINSKKELSEEATVAAPYEDYSESQQRFSVDDLAKYEDAIAAHFKKGFSKAVTFTEFCRFSKDKHGVITRLMRRGNEYKLIDDKGKVLLYDGFNAVYQDGSYGSGFNAYKKGRKSYYYNSEGKLIFDRKFDYVKNEWDGLYVVANDGKYGVADKAGNLLLPTKYYSATPIKTNHKLFFLVSDGHDQYFIQHGKNEKFLTASYVSHPLIIKDRYWLSFGKLYDMQSMKRLFCNLNDYIEVFDREKGLFYIRDNRTYMLTVFDIDGKLAYGQKVTRGAYINSSLSVYGVLAEDSTTKKNVYGLDLKYGIINTRNTGWQVQPTFHTLGVLDSNFIKYVNKRQVGLMDAKANVIFKEGMFKDFQVTSVPYSVLCINDSTSSLYNLKTKTFKNCNAFIASLQKNPGNLFITRYKSGKEWYTGFADKDLSIIELPKFKSIYFDNETKLFVCNLADNKAAYTSDEFKIYYDSSLKQQTQTINGKLYDRFQDIKYLSSFATLYSAGYKDDYVRINNRFIKTPYKVYKCDSLLNYFITYKDGKYGIVDFGGKEILPPVFSYISNNFQAGSITLALMNGKKVVIGSDGKVLFGSKYDEVNTLLKDYYIVTYNGKQGIVNSKDEEVLDIVYDYVYSDMGGVLYGNSYNDKHFISIADVGKKMQGVNNVSKNKNQSQVIEVNKEPEALISKPTEMSVAVEAPVDEEQDRIYTKVETEPTFPGGNAGWERYQARALKGFNPSDFGAEAGKYKVVVRFIVSKDGKVSDVQPETKFGYGMEEKAARILKEGPYWKPALLNGRYVNAYHRQAVFIIAEEMEVVAPSADEYSASVVAPEHYDEDQVFTKVENEAEFPGGAAVFERFKERSLGDFNPADNGAPPGKYTVLVKFIVSKDGSISSVQAETNIGYGMEEKAVKIIKNGPKWKPAMQNGRNVNAYRLQQFVFVVAEKKQSTN